MEGVVAIFVICLFGFLAALAVTAVGLAIYIAFWIVVLIGKFAFSLYIVLGDRSAK